jgi:hypothetical protein
VAVWLPKTTRRLQAWLENVGRSVNEMVVCEVLAADGGHLSCRHSRRFSQVEFCDWIQWTCSH